MSAKKRAAAALSRTGTMVWLRMIAMSCLLGGCFQVVAEYTAPGSIVSRPGQGASTADGRHLGEIGLPPSRQYRVGFSISNGEFAIDFSLWRASLTIIWKII